MTAEAYFFMSLPLIAVCVLASVWACITIRRLVAQLGAAKATLERIEQESKEEAVVRKARYALLVLASRWP